ncbi:MAG: secondary thiamine-phosphate synthase enzyme YjbQ [Gemmatimonadota bacterium]|nr:secondary thiamine-phosphate synthase enzyme YjbQ [Gemmatimonadota bacterium]
MHTWSGQIEVETDGNDQILDLTEDVQRAVAESGITTGQATAMVIGSTGALSTLEFEPGLVGHDIAAALEGIAPRDGHYVHEQTWNDDNGHSHVRACLIGPSLALPVIEGRIPLGTWQQVVLLDFDTRSRSRRIAVTVIGA